MKRLLPKSLFGQVMGSVMLALLVAQIVGAVLLYRASEDRIEAAALTALNAQIVFGSEQAGSPRRTRPRAEREEPRLRPPPQISDNPARRAARLLRRFRYKIDSDPAVPLSEANTGSARVVRLRELLEQEGIAVHQLTLEVRRAGADPELLTFASERPRLAARLKWRDLRLYVASLQRKPEGDWETARVFERQRPQGGLGLLATQTLLIYLFLGIILFVVLRRITRPLAKLTGRVDDFSRAPDRAVKLDETGPSDTRRLIAAHNKMEARIAALLDEKDVMLGAIGHDLKTPLAALRVRIESVPNEAQRARMAASIEDITRTLDDILSLARIVRASDGADAPEDVDIGALADSVVEEFEDLGEPVTLELAEGRNARMVAKVQVTWLKRALRNLVGNAVRYGGRARVSVAAEKGKSGRQIILRVEDDGPGIEESRIGEMLEPFTRGDASRSRATGGAGLGLTLARAIAEAHKGSLTLSNRYDGGAIQGLTAEIRIPG